MDIGEITTKYKVIAEEWFYASFDAQESPICRLPSHLGRMLYAVLFMASWPRQGSLPAPSKRDPTLTRCKP
jgi:hypothetical protein